MATNFKFEYRSGHGQLVGSYMSIGYGSVVNYVDLVLSHVPNTLGRYVTCAYWICDKHFDITDLNMDPTSLWGPRYCTSINTSKAGVNGIKYPGENFYTQFVNTNSISNDGLDTCRFNFNETISGRYNTNISVDKLGIKASKIFVALISTSKNYATYDYNNSTLSVCTDYGTTYVKDNLASNNIQVENNGGLYFADSLFTNPDGSMSDSEESNNVKPSKIACSDLRYRTWSDPGYDTFAINNSLFNSKYTLAFADGGHKYNDVSEFDTLSYSINNGANKILRTHIMNKTVKQNGNYLQSEFESDFQIPEGRLSDVVFANPEREAYDFEASTDISASEGRWVFKRSRIKFTIPPAIKNGKPIEKGIILRYRIITSLYDGGIYSTQYKIKQYSVAESTKNIQLVICPRDEGVLDNMEFTVELSRKYVGASDSQYSTVAAYKFRTYQKPTVNIAYPKIIRNSSTGNDFKYAKLLTSNMYSNFYGESPVVNKYVCDALNVILATPQNDASDIPMFVRFYLAEFKYGRDGKVKNEKAGSIQDGVDTNFDTMQELYKSSDSSKYISKEEILTGKFKNNRKHVAQITSIYRNDGQPILFSGRFTDTTLKDIGQKFKLWTYREWDNVDSTQDELVGNAWTVKGPDRYADGTIRTDSNGNPIKVSLVGAIVGDHVGKPETSSSKWPDGTNKIVQNVSKSLIFRAGYIYLLRVRMFHGAAAGGIAKKVDNEPDNYIKKKYRVIFGDVNSGTYDYTNAAYSAGREYPNTDIMQYGENRPYDGWIGPNDGTPGEPLFKGNENTLGSYNERLKQTYSGFSEVDYTLIEPVCPYTSKSNFVTVHPTSPQLSANQWITFNYRHLNKNFAGIDATSVKYNTSTNEYNIKSGVFGKTAGGIQNTITRIVSMYTSAVETILNNYDSKMRGKNLNATASKLSQFMGGPAHSCTESSPTITEKISLWIKPISGRKTTMESDDTAQNFSSVYEEYLDNDGNIKKHTNKPLIYDYGANGRAIADIYNDTFYNPASLCYDFNEYRLARTFGKSVSKYDKDSDTYDISDLSFESMPEWDIVIRKYNWSKKGTNESYQSLGEPLGNSYRWQPVINAMTSTGTSMSEIKIEDNSANVQIAKQYKSGDNTLRKNIEGRPISSDDITLVYADDESSKDYDLQTKYFYTDEHRFGGLELSFDNTDTKRFCINEFCGMTDAGLHVSQIKYAAAYPTMYTTANISSSAVGSKYGNAKSIKYFVSQIQIDKLPGKIFSRVPSIQDCECGIPTPSGLSNVGNVSSKGTISVNSNENNAIPITRTTHYLYFKTWINTTFCMRVDVATSVNHACRYSNPPPPGSPTHLGHDTTEKSGVYWFNGSSLQVDNTVVYDSTDSSLITTYPSVEIKLGNENGICEVYGEDNHGWGRCLSADDISNRSINYDGTISSTKTESGGIEVPVMVRYTPLLQPKLLAKTCTNKNKSNSDITYLSLTSSNITLTKFRGKKEWVSEFVDATLSDEGKSTQIKTDQIDLKVAYPYIDETGTYQTVMPNGGNSGNVYFDNYYIDVDTDANKLINSASSTDEYTNRDFVGGTGICTAYTVILVPSNPKLPDKSSFEYKWYFNNTDEHWNFYKQPANYYKLKNIFSDVRSKTVKDCGPVLVAYNLQVSDDYENTCGYLDNNIIVKNKIPSDFIDSRYIQNYGIDNFLGRNFQNISLNFSALRQGKVALFENDNVQSQSVANDILGFDLDKNNILQPGVIYDLVIIPVYSNRKITDLNYTKSSNDTINGNAPGGGIDETFASSDITKKVGSVSGEVHLAGSNPLVLYNYLQIGLETESSGGGSMIGPGPGPIPDPDPEEPDPNYVWDSDSAIVFPNVDNELFNVKSGTIKEPPGFWLNNSFRLILRMPSFRLKGEEYSHSDTNTIDNASNGQLLTSNGDTPDDFEFSDIQIHIGKISELQDEKYGYPDNQHLKLDKITDMKELARAHIISYKDYGHMGMGVFSKKLSTFNDAGGTDEDTRELLTAGSLNPKSNEYSHRFIEVNLSNCKIMNKNGDLVPVYTEYPEGFYIQFRWKSKYAESQPEEHRWSDWYGGTYDGGHKWWGPHGLNYFVPIRNYSTVYTDFRNHIKESYPGANTLPKEPIELSQDIIDRISSVIAGKGSIMQNGSINESSKNNPKDSVSPKFYHVGVGNHEQSPIVPTNEKLNVDETLTAYNIYLTENNDAVYTTAYNEYHDKNGPITGGTFTNHQNFWEMLYVDYIIRNMCKLYYKPKYNAKDGNYKMNDNLYYHLSTPGTPDALTLDCQTWGWDNTEYRMFNDDTLIQSYKGSTNEQEFSENKNIMGDKLYPNGIRLLGPNNLSHTDIETYSNRQQWDRHKYYRRIITRQDFDELNKHLEDLVTFMRHSYFTGLNNNNFDMVGDAVPISKDELLAAFPKARWGIIGHDTSTNSGLTAEQSNNNNINHTMVSNNYIQNIWQNILSVCRPSIQADTKRNIK